MNEQTLMSATMQRFLQSKISQYGGEKPFTLDHDAIDFEAVSWWDVDEHMVIAVVLPDIRYLFAAFMTMHDYVIEQWNNAVRDYIDKKPQCPEHKYTDSDGTERTIREYYDIDSVRSFPYFMALIVNETTATKMRGYELPFDFEIYIVRDNGQIYVRLPQPPPDSKE